jgi:hypothetical protein
MVHQLRAVTRAATIIGLVGILLASGASAESTNKDAGIKEAQLAVEVTVEGGEAAMNRDGTEQSINEDVDIEALELEVSEGTDESPHLFLVFDISGRLSGPRGLGSPYFKAMRGNYGDAIETLQNSAFAGSAKVTAVQFSGPTSIGVPFRSKPLAEVSLTCPFNPIAGESALYDGLHVLLKTIPKNATGKCNAVWLATGGVDAASKAIENNPKEIRALINHQLERGAKFFYMWERTLVNRATLHDDVDAAAKVLGIPSKDVLPFSTGVVGRAAAMEIIANKIASWWGEGCPSSGDAANVGFSVEERRMAIMGLVPSTSSPAIYEATVNFVEAAEAAVASSAEFAFDPHIKAGAWAAAHHDSGETTLHWAAKNAKLNTIARLGAAGVDLNVPDQKGMTATHMSVEQKQYDVIKALGKAGADLDKPDMNSFTPLLGAMQFDDLEAIQTLVGAGADVNAGDEHGGTPLHWAASKGKLKVIDLLLELGADPHLWDDNGWPSIHNAVFSEQLDAVRCLLHCISLSFCSLADPRNWILRFVSQSASMRVIDQPPLGFGG